MDQDLRANAETVCVKPPAQTTIVVTLDRVKLASQIKERIANDPEIKRYEFGIVGNSAHKNKRVKDLEDSIRELGVARGVLKNEIKSKVSQELKLKAEAKKKGIALMALKKRKPIGDVRMYKLIHKRKLLIVKRVMAYERNQKTKETTRQMRTAHGSAKEHLVTIP